MPSSTDQFDEIPPHERPWLWRPAWPAWFIAKRIAKSLLGISGLISAILVILAAGTYLRATWNNFEDYETLRPLAAGMSEGRLAQALGEPSTIREITIDRGGFDSVVSLRRYIEDHFVVSAFVDGSGEVILMSVLSCDTAFHPRFTTPGFTTDPLNSGTLAQIHSTNPDGVEVDYIRETTGGGPVVYTETVGADASRATRNHAWAWASTRCATRGTSSPTRRTRRSSRTREASPGRRIRCSISGVRPLRTSTSRRVAVCHSMT